MRKFLLTVVLCLVVVICVWGAYIIIKAEETRSAPREKQGIATPGSESEKTTAPAAEKTEFPESPKPEEKESASISTIFSGRIIVPEGIDASSFNLQLYSYHDLFSYNVIFDENIGDVKATATAKPDETGRFSFSGIPRGVYILKGASSEGLDFSTYASITIREDQPMTDFEFPLPSGEPLKGKLVNWEDEPVSGGKVMFRVWSEDTHERFTAPLLFMDSCRTSEDGEFSFPSAPRNISLVFSATGPEGSLCMRTENISKETDSLPEFRLREQPRVQGRVYLPDGTPAAGASILPSFHSEDSPDGVSYFMKILKTDDDGGFRIPALEAGELTLNVRMPGAFRAATETVQISSGKKPEFLEIELEPGETLYGAVVDDSGASITRALVCSERNNILKCVRTNECGEFNFVASKDKTLSLIIVTPGGLKHEKKIMNHEGEKIIIDVSRGVGIEGKVTDKNTGEPLRPAVVQTDPYQLLSRTLTNSRGEYHLFFVHPAENAGVAAFYTGYAPDYHRDLALNSGETIKDLDFRMIPGGTVSGYVFDQDSEEPIPDADIYVTGERVRIAKTDETGFYNMENITPGSFTISAGADGYARETGLKLDIGNGEHKENVNFYLSKLAGISGRVINREKEPVSNAEVGAVWGRMRKFAGFRRMMKTTDEKGEFELNNLPAGEPVVLKASHENYADGEAGPFILNKGERKENVEIVLTPGGSISGIITDNSEKPLAEAEAAQSEEEESFIGANIGKAMVVLQNGEFINAGENGRYTIEHLAPGTYTVFARAPGFVYEMREGVAVKEGEQTGDVNFQLSEAVSLAGRVKNDNDEFLEGVKVSAMAIDMVKPTMGIDTTDEQGYFKIDGLRPKTYIVVLEKDPYPQLMEMNVPVPDDDALFILESGGGLSGVVLDDRERTPVTNYEIKAEYSPGGFMEGRMMMGAPNRYNQTKKVDNEKGIFVFEGLKAGKYDLIVNAPDYAVEKVKGVEVVSGEEKKDVVIEMKKGSRISGRVLSAIDDSPVSGASVSLKEGKSDMFGMQDQMDKLIPWERRSVFSNEEGKYVLENVATGLRSLKAEKKGYLDGEKMVFVLRGKDSENVDIKISSGGVIVGSVVSDSTNEPVIDAEVTWTGQGFLADMNPMFRESTATDTEGKFRLENVPAGTRSLKVSHEDYSSKIVEKLSVSEGQTLDAGVIRLTSGGGIAGVVLDVDGYPISDAYLMSNGPASDMKQTTTNSEGEYSFSDLTPGAYTVTLIPEYEDLTMGRMDRSQEKQAVVEEGEITELNFIFVPGYSLSGTITRNGEPADNVSISCQSADRLSQSIEGGSKNVNENGTYEFKELQPGPYNINVFSGQMNDPEAFQPLFHSQIVLEDDMIYDIDLPTMSVSGVVMDSETREPVAGASVTVIRGDDPVYLEDFLQTGRFGEITDKTNSSGEYRLENIQEGAVFIVAKHDEYAYGKKSVNISTGSDITGLDFLLDPGLSLKGEAVLQESGLPVSKLYVSMFDPSEGIPVFNNYATLDSEGNYAITGLREGDYKINAWPENAAPRYGIWTPIRAGEDNILNLSFLRGGTLRLNVTDPQGSPVSRASVQIYSSSGQQYQLPVSLDNLVSSSKLTYTDAEGTFERENVPPGNIRIVVNADSMEKWSGDAVIENGEETVLDVEMQPETE